MKDIYNKAFIEAYATQVADVEEDEVIKFMAAFDADSKTIYEDFQESYTSILDAMGMFDAGIRFASKYLDNTEE